MKKIGILLLICSILILIATSIAFGFYKQIKATGFDFGPLGFCLICLSGISAIMSIVLIATGGNEGD